MDVGDKHTLCKSSRVREGKTWEDNFKFPLGPGIVQNIRGALGLDHLADPWHAIINNWMCQAASALFRDHVERIGLGGISECQPAQIVI